VFEGPTAVAVAEADAAAAAAAAAMAGYPAGDLNAFLGAPIQDRAGRRLGVLAVWDRAPRVWTREESDLARDSAGALALVLEGHSASPRRGSAQDASRAEIDTLLRTVDTPIIAFE